MIGRRHSSFARARSPTASERDDRAEHEQAPVWREQKAGETLPLQCERSRRFHEPSREALRAWAPPPERFRTIVSYATGPER